MGDHVTPPKPLEHGHVVQVFGLPNMRTVLHCLPPKDWTEPGFMGLGMIYTAMPVTNAVPDGPGGVRHGGGREPGLRLLHGTGEGRMRHCPFGFASGREGEARAPHGCEYRCGFGWRTGS